MLFEDGSPVAEIDRRAREQSTVEYRARVYESGEAITVAHAHRSWRSRCSTTRSRRWRPRTGGSVVVPLFLYDFVHEIYPAD